ncbi:Gfo/Idh/MocA family protein [Aquipuribacter sp. SD81]|uniref:Gfo/Idh/MocA family protein n=1 Tax=Aquipuribacter sp. SD81 TaxID=3127703 RepID=UPI003019954F
MSRGPGVRLCLHWLVDLSDAHLADAVADLRLGLRGAGVEEAPGARDAHAVLVWRDTPPGPALVDRLARLGVPVVLAGPTLAADPDGAWTGHTGLVTGPVTPAHDVRVRAGRDAGGMAARLVDHRHGTGAHLGEHVHVHDRVLRVEQVDDDVAVLLTAAVGLAVHPVASRRGPVLAWLLGGTPTGVASPTARRLLLLALHELVAATGRPASAPRTPVRAALLGYGAIGHEHAAAFREVTGLGLELVCDRNPERLAAAREVSPGLRTTTDAAAAVEDPDVDLVVVSTPPDTHAEWALRAVRAGKHVVVEKPFAIRTEEADAVLAAADEAGVLAVVYQNRRWDPDYLAVARAVRSGRLGEVFHVEAFVGGFGHPCNLWHSDVDASGGAFYDWGAHVIDQLLDLFPAPVAHVSATTHKRRWFDVTNADHSRVLVHFADGAEAEFTHSDLAAALKPRWYVLGTAGALVGSWRVERVVSRNAVGTLEEDVLAPADSPPVLDLHDADGSVTRLATPSAPPHPFHRELADHLLLGLPMSVTGATSRRVLAVMEAASASAADGGRPVVPR